MDLKALFDVAVADSKLIEKKPAVDILLKLYSLHKQATIGDVNIDPPTGMFDFVGKAKFGAWETQKGKAQEVAMAEFIDMINEIKLAAK